MKIKTICPVKQKNIKELNDEFIKTSRPYFMKKGKLKGILGRE